jgi:hypothetical protein
MPVSEVNKKIVIWGYPHHSHTHSYIHYGFYKAFSHLGYEVQWVDDVESNVDVSLKDCIIISEVNCKRFLPIQKDSIYFIHNLKQDFSKTEYDNVHNFLVYHENYNWSDEVKKIDDHFWYCEKTKTPVIMWGTDLLPYEIDQIKPSFYDESRQDVYFVGTVQGKNIVDFAHICANNGKNFYNLGGYTGSSDNDGSHFYSEKNSIQKLKNSYISFDIREDGHLNNGYIPCRIFKNISYGLWTGSNSPKLEKFFGDKITISKELNNLYSTLVQDYKNCTSDRIRESMEFVKQNHTYINRVNSLLSVL